MKFATFFINPIDAIAFEQALKHWRDMFYKNMPEEYVYKKAVVPGNDLAIEFQVTCEIPAALMYLGRIFQTTIAQ